MQYDDESKIMHVIFHGILKQELAMEHFDAILEFALNNPIHCILADLTQLRGSYIKFFDYFQENAYPKLLTNGFRAHAIIISDDLIVENISKKLSKLHLQMGIESKIFTHLEKGEKWLNDILKDK